MCVVQQFNWSAEPFTTSFVYRKPGRPWAWFYYDHEDHLPWLRGDVELDTDARTAVFYRGKAPAVTFMWESETYTLHGNGTRVVGAQELLPADWSPEQSVYARQ